MQPNARHLEADIEDVILDVLERRGVTPTAEIYRLVKDRLDLTLADQQKSRARPWNTNIEVTIANALRDICRLCQDGLIERVARGEFRITAAGKAYLKEHRDRVERMVKSLSEMFPESYFE